MTNHSERDAVSTRSAFLGYLAEFAGDISLRDAADSLALYECGLDSLSLFEFIVGLEERFEIKIPHTEFNASRFRHVGDVVEFLNEASTNE